MHLACFVQKLCPVIFLKFLLLGNPMSFIQGPIAAGVQAPSSAHCVLCYGWAQGLSCTSSRFITLSHTENQCLICAACQQGPDFFLAPCMCWWVHGFILALPHWPGDRVYVEMLFLLSLQLFLRGVCLICIFLVKNSNFGLLSHLYF